MKRLYTDRNRAIIAGAIGMLLLFAVITVGIKASFGAFAGGYELQGSFAAAGQGLISGSDVKIRGVNVGEVERIELEAGRALVTMRMNDGIEVPVDAEALIRAKTLFGEKFVDIEPGPNELDGPFLEGGDTIERSTGGFELEEVLTDTFPILKAIDPAELAIVITELADAGDGLGENINRSIVNAATLTELQASNDAEVRQFLSDLALLSESLATAAPELLRGADALNEALPTLIDGSDDLNTALVQLARLSGDVADLLEANEEFTTNALTNGSKTLQLLFDQREQIPSVLLGLQQYTQTFAEAIRFEAQDGSMMAAVKNLLSLDGLLGGLGLESPLAAPAPATPSASTPAADAGLPSVDDVIDTINETTNKSAGIVSEALSLLLPGRGDR